MNARVNDARYIPEFTCDNPDVNRAYQIAVDDISANIEPFRDGLLAEAAPCIIAGRGYDTPWTRDAAINVWNGAGLLFPEASRNTLLSVLARDARGVRVGGQYWDAIIWAVGAWHYWLYTGDREFFDLAKQSVVHSIRYFEETEFDPERGLFRGPACYGDGVAAYPDRYVAGESFILTFRDVFPEKCAGIGYGMPMFTLSTNCLYYEAYRIAHRMTADPEYARKAERMRAAINRAFWDVERGTYRYLVDGEGTCDAQEALGLSFALLFGVADDAQAESVVRQSVVTSQGMPCLWPGFERYSALGYGRHSGTVWPHGQAFWADAAASRSPEALRHELMALTRNALREGFFSEIYHPETGLPYGGVQESGGTVNGNWESQPRQTWSATGYLRMLLFGVLGLRFGESDLRISPRRIDGIGRVRLSGLHWRDMILDIGIGASGFEGKTAVIPYQAGGCVSVSM